MRRWIPLLIVPVRVSADLVQVARARLVAEGMDATTWSDGPGDRYAPHAHDHDKVLVVVQGSITFRLTALGSAHELLEGDRLDLPAGTTHAADVGPSGVRCLEGHLPTGTLRPEPRRMADWVRGPRQARPQTDGHGET